MINIITGMSSIMGNQKSKAGITNESRVNVTPIEVPKERFSPLPKRRIKPAQSGWFQGVSTSLRKLTASGQSTWCSHGFCA